MLISHTDELLAGVIMHLTDCAAVTAKVSVSLYHVTCSDFFLDWSLYLGQCCEQSGFHVRAFAKTGVPRH
jgi:hypothetical protein